MHCEESEREHKEKSNTKNQSHNSAQVQSEEFFSPSSLIRDNCTLHKLMCFLFTFYEVLTIFFASSFCMMFFPFFFPLPSTNNRLQLLKEGDFCVEEIHILDLKME